MPAPNNCAVVCAVLIAVLAGAMNLFCQAVSANPIMQEQPTPSSRAGLDPLPVNALPSGTNFLTAIDFSLLDRSEWAQSDGIVARDLIDVPEDTEQVLLGSETELGYFAANTQTALIRFRNSPASRDPMKRPGDARIETVGGNQLVWINENSVAIPLRPNGWAVLLPGDREQLEKMLPAKLDSADDRAQTVSEFLRYAAEQVDRESTLATIAIDFQGILSLETVTQFVVDGNLFDPANVTAAQELLASLQGAVVTVQATDQLTGKIQLRFDKEAKLLEGKAVPLVENVLNSIGMNIAGLNQWQSSVEGEVIILEGKLQRGGLGDLLSLAIQDYRMPAAMRDLASLENSLRENRGQTNPDGNPGGDAGAPGQRDGAGEESAGDPDANVANPPEKSNPAAQQKAAMANATEDYLHRLRRLLQNAHNKTALGNLAQSRFWLDRYAFAIQYLDRKNVDPELLEFADDLTQRVSGMAETLQTAGVQAISQLDDNWVYTPTWRTFNYGGIRIRRGAWFYTGFNRGLSDQATAGAVIDSAAKKVKTTGIDIVRDYNAIAEQLSSRYRFEHERWTPGALK